MGLFTFRLSSKKRLLALSPIFDTDLVIMDAHGSVCPECAKYQGRVYSISGKSKIFPKVPSFFYSGCGVHPGCSHTFWPYIHGVNDPDLAYTLTVHPLKDPQYGMDIITFSNRPFVDDRTDECKAAAEAFLNGETREQKYMREFEERMKKLEAQKKREEQDFHWLCMNFPDKCPKSVTGYRRMKTQNTKNYQTLKTLAAELGREI